MLLRERPYDYALLPSERPVDDDLVANLEIAVRLGWLPVDVDLSVPAGLLGFGAGLEQAGDIEPQIEAHRWFGVRGSWFWVRRSWFVVRVRCH
jgi:hypothetical protein